MPANLMNITSQNLVHLGLRTLILISATSYHSLMYKNITFISHPISFTVYQSPFKKTCLSYSFEMKITICTLLTFVAIASYVMIV